MSGISKYIYPLFQISDSAFLAFKNGMIGFYNIDDDSFIFIAMLPLNWYKRFLSHFRLFVRLFRLEPRCAEKLNDDNYIISFNGGIYKLCISERKLQKEFKFRQGMSNVLNFTKIKNLEGFEDCILFGDYFGNASHSEVNIYKRKLEDNADWELAYTFKPGIIRHIHNIIPDYFRKGLIVLTGDSDAESGLWLIKDNFKVCNLLFGGKQNYRACAAYPFDKGFYFFTDTPTEQNYMYMAEENKKSWRISEICKIPGPVIYSTKILEDIYFSTTVEYDPTVGRYKKLFSNKKGKGIVDNFMHLFVFDGKKISEITKFEKDCLPMGLFQHGSIKFPKQEYKGLHVFVIAAKRFDGTWLLIDKNKDRIYTAIGDLQ